MSKLFKLSVAAGAAPLAVGVQAQAFPARPVTLTLPFAAGGPTDKLARDLAEALRKPLGGATVVVTDGRVEPEGHRKFVADEVAKWGAVIKAAGQYAACAMAGAVEPRGRLPPRGFLHAGMS